jgi:hypothetical protein
MLESAIRRSGGSLDYYAEDTYCMKEKQHTVLLDISCIVQHGMFLYGSGQICAKCTATGPGVLR